MSILVVVSIAGCSLQITEATEPPKFISLAAVAHFLWLSTKPNILNTEGGLGVISSTVGLWTSNCNGNGRDKQLTTDGATLCCALCGCWYNYSHC